MKDNIKVYTNTGATVWLLVNVSENELTEICHKSGTCFEYNMTYNIDNMILQNYIKSGIFKENKTETDIRKKTMNAEINMLKEQLQQLEIDLQKSKIINTELNERLAILYTKEEEINLLKKQIVNLTSKLQLAEKTLEKNQAIAEEVSTKKKK